MKQITEVRFFECMCSKCGCTIQNKEGLKSLKENDWLELSNDILCPKCLAYYKTLRPQVGDKVLCLIQDKARQLIQGKRYTVSELVESDDCVIYVDVGNGWQSKLLLGEYDC